MSKDDKPSSCTKFAECNELICLGLLLDHFTCEDGSLRVHFNFVIVWSLVVVVLLRTSYVNRFVKRILPVEGKVVLYNSNPLQILMLTMHTSKDVQEHNQPTGSISLVESDDVNSEKVQVVRKGKSLQMSQCVIPVSTSAGGLVFVSSSPSFS